MSDELEGDVPQPEEGKYRADCNTCGRSYECEIRGVVNNWAADHRNGGVQPMGEPHDVGDTYHTTNFQSEGSNE